MGRCSVLQEVLAFKYASKTPSTETMARMVNDRKMIQSMTFMTFLRHVESGVELLPIIDKTTDLLY